jgi:hypothetical protein
MLAPARADGKDAPPRSGLASAAAPPPPGVGAGAAVVFASVRRSRSRTLAPPPPPPPAPPPPPLSAGGLGGESVGARGGEAAACGGEAAAGGGGGGGGEAAGWDVTATGALPRDPDALLPVSDHFSRQFLYSPLLLPPILSCCSPPPLLTYAFPRACHIVVCDFSLSAIFVSSSPVQFLAPSQQVRRRAGAECSTSRRRKHIQ